MSDIPAPVKIARCPIHGFVGERDVLRFHDGEERCLICDGDPDLTTEIERVEMVPVEEVRALLDEVERHRAHNWIEFCEFLTTGPTEQEMVRWSDALNRRATAAEALVASGGFGRLSGIRSADVLIPPPTSTQAPATSEKAEPHPGDGGL